MYCQVYNTSHTTRSRADTDRQTDRLPWLSGPRPLSPCWLWAPWAPAPPVYPHRSLPPWLIYQITHTQKVSLKSTQIEPNWWIQTNTKSEAALEWERNLARRGENCCVLLYQQPYHIFLDNDGGKAFVGGSRQGLPYHLIISTSRCSQSTPIVQYGAPSQIFRWLEDTEIVCRNHTFISSINRWSREN